MKRSWFVSLLVLGSGLLLTGLVEIKVGAGALGGTGAAWACIPTPTPTPTPIPLGVAVNNQSLSWSTSGQAQWFGQAAVSHDGQHAAQSGDIADNQSSSLVTSVSGAGQLSFWWAVSSEANYDYLRFYLDGVDQGDALSGNVGWVQRSFSIPAGTHELKWIFSKDVNVSDGSDCGWVDQVVFTPTLGEALDAPALSWTTAGSGGKVWLAQTAVTHDGVDAAQSGDINDNETVSLSTVLNGPGTLSFWWKVSSESGWDYLRFYINDAQQPGAISGETGWQFCSFQLPPGAVRLRWDFQKDGSVSAGADCGWVDQIVLTPLAAERMGLSVTTLSDASLKVKWSAVAGATAYQVYRTDEPNGTGVAAGSTTGLEMVDSAGLRGGTRYYYWVLASVAGTQTVSSDVASGLTLPSAPVLKVETLSNRGLRLSWPAVTGAASGYRIYRTNAQLSTHTLLGVATTPAFDDLSCQEAACYWYRVKAIGEAGESEYSNAANGWTAPNPPSGLTVSADDSTSPTHAMLLTFTDNSARESGFIVERSPNGADGWTSTTLGGHTGVGGTVTYHDTDGISEGRHYWYRVKASLNVTP